MPRIQFILSLAMAALAVFASILLGMGQEEATRPLLMVTAATLAVYFTDYRQVFWLSRTVANSAAVGAVAMSLYDFVQFDRDQQLLAIANLLIYLQIVVLFQQKSVRIFWQIVMLSLLQVVVAAALNSSVVFGALLVVFLFCELLTLTLFFVYREALDYLPSPDGETLIGTPAAGQGRWSWLQGSAGAVRFSATGRDEMRAAARKMELPRVSVRMALTTLVVTVLIFLIVPRFGTPQWRGAIAGTQRTVGFSQQVTLGALGDVVENPDIVMRVQLIDARRETPFQLKGEPLFRGSVVTTYARQQWSFGVSRLGMQIESLPTAPSRRNLVKQSFTLEPLDEPVVFSIEPPYRLSKNSIVGVDLSRDQLVRPRRLQQSQVNFELGTTGVVDRVQVPFTAERDPPSLYDLHRLLQLPTAAREDEPDPLRGLKQTAREVLEKAQVPLDDHYLICQTLNGFLRSGGGFQYSLRGQSRDPQLDAVEDFVVNHRVGHCEYFASALTLMLRSQGVPARMALGYKGGEYNPVGEFYQVRQLHAHAWVEAYLSPEMLTDRLIDAHDPARHGGWLRLDPTTDAGAEPPGAATTFLAQFGQVYDYLEMLWISNVVGMTSEQQKRAIYDPLAESAGQLAQALMGKEAEGRTLWQRATTFFRALWKWLRGNWFSWKGALAAMGLSLVCVGLYVYLWPRLRALAARLRRQAPTAHRTRIEFYQRLENVLARHGYQRLAGQTPREFATATGGQLAETSALRAAAPLPRRLVDAFYRVRFGRRDLTPHEAEEVARELDLLEAALAASP